jgi:hypothetical protein
VFILVYYADPTMDSEPFNVNPEFHQKIQKTGPNKVQPRNKHLKQLVVSNVYFNLTHRFDALDNKTTVLFIMFCAFSRIVGIAGVCGTRTVINNH